MRVVPEGIDLLLDHNERVRIPEEFLRLRERIRPDTFTRYRFTDDLELELAKRFGVGKENLVTTAGSNDAIDRICRCYLNANRNMITTEPTFEMIPLLGARTGARVIRVPWLTEPFPVERVMDAADGQIALVVVVSPNNPTGQIATLENIRALSEKFSTAIVLLDFAYIEFADYDFTREALALPNVVITRTFSKAYGLAGLRVGYALGATAIIDKMRAIAPVYSVSALSARIVLDTLAIGGKWTEEYLENVRLERELLCDLLRSFGAQPNASQGNFMLAKFANADHVYRRLIEQGILVRSYAYTNDMTDYLRITCPGNAQDFVRLKRALCSIFEEKP